MRGGRAAIERYEGTRVRGASCGREVEEDEACFGRDALPLAAGGRGVADLSGVPGGEGRREEVSEGASKSSLPLATGRPLGSSLSSSEREEVARACVRVIGVIGVSRGDSDSEICSRQGVS